MEKVIFTDPDTKEKIEFYVLEETQINGKKFLFVTGTNQPRVKSSRNIATH